MTTPLPELIGDYWDIAYTEGLGQVSQGTVAQEKLSEINEAIKAYGAAEYQRGIVSALAVLASRGFMNSSLYLQVNQLLEAK